MDAMDPLVWPILLTIAGCALMVLEVFIPSGGVLSILSVASFIAAVILAFLTGGPSTGITFATVIVVAVPLMLTLAFKYLPNTPIGKALLGDAPSEEQVATDDPRRELIGRIGIARSKMLPAGAVEIDGQIVDAVARGKSVEPGEKVKVLEVQGNRVVVRLAPDASASRTGEILSQSIEDLGIKDLGIKDLGIEDLSDPRS